MKNILFITDIGSPWGGSEELWSKSAIELVKKGYNVSAVTNYFGKPYHFKTINVIDKGVQVYFRKNKLRDNIRKVAQKFNKKIVSDNLKTNTESILNKIKPDLVVFSQSSCFSAYKDMLFCYENGYKYCSVSQLNLEFNWPNDSTYLNIRKAFVNAEKTFFVSQGNLDLFQTQIAYSLVNAEVISNPFNFDKVPDLSWPNMDKIRFAYVARLAFNHKGTDILFKAFAEEQWKDRNFELNIYGGGDIELAKETAKYFGVHNINFKGHVNSIEDIWKDNHALVLSSRYEGMPLSIIEAMFSKRIVITTDVAGHAEFIEDDINGYLADAASYKLYANTLEKAWNGRDKWQSMGENAFTKVMAKSTSDPVKVFSDKLQDIL
ncbi:glycosyltransferase [Winogradskyella litoriviva]|uniref:Glycosyltransferase n=1 Tax=Winogradskyella litoriviva TaxID=1220182 RepID=A0ABX2E407_9FLAO|nr:glycosyltransferase [Winogradskyella litoriviva]NRD23234.1 glycosyltransferase [Winogradskyella litoriviva]